jgi:small GTP-binding protein
MKDVKSCLCGDTGVGKTTLVHRYLRRTFLMSDNVTIGASYQCRHVSGTCRLHLWDTAGQERFRSLCPMYLRHSHLTWVVTDRLEAGPVRRWVAESRHANPQALLVLVLTKLDTCEAAAPLQALRELAADQEIEHCFAVSSKTAEGCEELFRWVETTVSALAVPETDVLLPVVERSCCT